MVCFLSPQITDRQTTQAGFHDTHRMIEVPHNLIYVIFVLSRIHPWLVTEIAFEGTTSRSEIWELFVNMGGVEDAEI